MKNSTGLCIVLLFGNFWATLGAVQLDAFLKAVDDAELEELVGPFAGEVLARFEDKADLNGGEAWYQSFRAMECQHGGGCQKKPLRWIPKNDDEDYESGEEENRLRNTPNDLSHEANYKLSKVEQDSEEDAKWRTSRHFKRRVNPMDVVKLKTSLRMLRNGEGLLPPILTLSREGGGSHSVGDKLSSQIGIGSWKGQYDVRPGRKLFSVEESPSEMHSQELPENDLLVFMRTEAFQKLQNYAQELHDKKNASSTKEVHTVPLNLSDKERDVNIKLHMSVNATVLGDNKLPESFHRNDTVTFQPPLEIPKGEEGRRDRRRVVFPLIPEQGAKGEIRKSVIEATKDFPQDNIVSGRLTSQLVAAVFEVVKTTPSLKVLWPGLMRNGVPLPTDMQDFTVIKTEDNESELRRAEDMLRQAMEAVNSIIEQQVRSRSCVPLPPDLQAFYNLILQAQAQWENSQKFQKRTVVGMSDNQLRQKSKIIKKLLRDYEELPRDDQKKAARVKRSLLVAAQQLRQMKQQSNRRRRQITHLEDTPADHHFSPEYTKLARTAELLLHTSLTDADTPVGLIYI